MSDYRHRLRYSPISSPKWLNYTPKSHLRTKSLKLLPYYGKKFSKSKATLFNFDWEL